MIAFAAAIIGLVLGFFVSYVLNYSDFVLKRVIDVLSLVALAVPGVVLGIGYIFVWNQRWIESVGVKMYGTPRIIVLASVAAAIPVITRVLTGGMAKIPRPILCSTLRSIRSSIHRTIRHCRSTSAKEWKI